MQLIQQLLAFRPSRMDIIFALKTYLTAIIALFFSFYLDLLNPIWSIGTVLIIANPYAGMVSSKAIFRIGGTAIGAIVAILLMPHLINLPWIFSLVIAAWVGFCLYISLLDRTPRSYMLMLSGYTVAMIVFNAINSVDTHSIFDIALARFLEIGIAVICSAVVSAVILPVHVGPVIQQRIDKNLNSLEQVFSSILANQKQEQNYIQTLNAVTRDMSEIHVMTEHLSYENSDLKGMTHPLQEMLHQLSMAVSNLVAMSERLQQLNVHDQTFDQHLAIIRENVIQHIKDKKHIEESQLEQMFDDFETQFNALTACVSLDQKVILNSFRMDVRHYIYNIRIVLFIWQNIQDGKKDFPKNIVPLTTKYPSLHRDHGVALRGGLAAFLGTFAAAAIWIVSGWKAGFMLAQMAAVTSCIVTAIDNPVPVLKTFILASILSCGVVFVYAFAILPGMTEFWQLALVLAPPLILFTVLIPTPSLMALGLMLGITTVMSMNIQNRYSIDIVSFLEGSFATVLGVVCALIAIYFIRAMSPETTAQRILSQHYKAMRQAINLSYDTRFRIHLRSMLDRIGILNSKMVQSSALKQAMNRALIETSAIVDFTRVHELAGSQLISTALQQSIVNLQNELNTMFNELEKNTVVSDQTKDAVVSYMNQAEQVAYQEENENIKFRVLMSLNNIRSSIFHTQAKNAIHVGETAL